MKLRVIRDDCGNPYLCRLTFFDVAGYSLKLHLILRSDRDRELHDHPWTFVSLMLCGGYREHTPKGSEWIRPGSIRINRAPHPHRLEVVNAAATLVFTFPKCREWGFYKAAGWVPWFKYKSDQEC